MSGKTRGTLIDVTFLLRLIFRFCRWCLSCAHATLSPPPPHHSIITRAPPHASPLNPHCLFRLWPGFNAEQNPMSSPACSLEILAISHHRPTILPGLPCFLGFQLHLLPATSHLSFHLQFKYPRSSRPWLLTWSSLARLVRSAFAALKYDQPLTSLWSVSGVWIPSYPSRPSTQRMPAHKIRSISPY